MRITGSWIEPAGHRHIETHQEKGTFTECALFWPVGKPIKSTQKMHEIRQIGVLVIPRFTVIRMTMCSGLLLGHTICKIALTVESFSTIPFYL